MNGPVVPSDFRKEAEEAFTARDRIRLRLLLLEIENLSWQAAGQSLLQNFLSQLPEKASADRLVLFTGHRIDVAGRTPPRFPPDKEQIARLAITETLIRQQANGTVTGMAGAANGGDILFLEACRELHIPFTMLLALPENQYLAKSVATPQGDWVQRFHSLARESSPFVMSQTNALPAWLSEKPGYSFWARNNLWMISAALDARPKHFFLEALWDGQAGDGPGGTENMVQVAQVHGAHFIHLDTRVLFNNQETTRTAGP